MTVSQANDCCELTDHAHRALAAVEALDAQLSARGRLRVATHRQQALNAQAYGRTETDSNSIDHIVLVACADLPPVVRLVLEHIASGSTEVTVLLATTAEAETAGHDQLGQIDPGYWTTAPVPLDTQQLVSVGSTDEQTAAVVRLAEQAQRSGVVSTPLPADELAVIVPDAADEPALRRGLANQSIPLRVAAGTPVVQSGPGRLLAALCDVLRTQQPSALLSLARQPSVRSRLPKPPADHKNRSRPQHAALGVLVDELHDHPGQPINRLAPEAVYARQVVEFLRLPLPGLSTGPAQQPLTQHIESLSTLLTRLLPDTLAPDSDDAEAVAAIGQAMRDIVAGFADHPDLTGTIADCAAVVLDALSDAHLPERGGEACCEALGPLEMMTEEAPVLAVLHACEGAIPDGQLADPFWPNHLRQRLGLPCDRTRHARDAYSLTMAAAQRCADSFAVVIPRHDSSAQPLVPSRLIFQTNPQHAAQRARALFGEAADRTASGLPAQLRLPSGRAPDLGDADTHTNNHANNHTNTNENADGLVPPLPDPDLAIFEPLAVTALKDWIACPYRFYLKHILRARSQDAPEDELAANTFGTLIHDALDRWSTTGAEGGTSSDAVGAAMVAALDSVALERLGAGPDLPVRLQLHEARRRLRVFAHTWGHPPRRRLAGGG